MCGWEVSGSSPHKDKNEKDNLSKIHNNCQFRSFLKIEGVTKRGTLQFLVTCSSDQRFSNVLIIHSIK